MKRLHRLPGARSAALLIVVLGVFAVYAPAIRLMLLHDDTAIVSGLRGAGLLDVFVRVLVSGGANYRPVGDVWWVLICQWFGWFWPPLLHAWNIWAHTLNVALVGALAARLGRMWGLPGAVFPALAALIFGVFPFSFQAVLWAGSIYHPVMVAFGLAGLLAYLRARTRPGRGGWLLAVALLLGACLSHEAGFIFGALALAIELLAALRPRAAGGFRLRWQAVALFALTLAYPLAYRLIIHTTWSDPGGQPFAGRPDLAANLLYFAQGIIAWMLILLRPVIALDESRAVVIAGLFAAGVGLALVALGRLKLAPIGLFALAVWAAAIAPSAVLLAHDYVRPAPRLMYASSIGIALFWAALTAGLLNTRLHRALKIALVAGLAPLAAWCVPYIADRLNETARLTPALRQIDAEERASDPAAKVLLVNPPAWSAPAYGAFPIGAEGMPIAVSYVPASFWVGAVSGTLRDTVAVRHDISLTRGQQWGYGIESGLVDDAALRVAILDANQVYRFDYDPPGLRVRRLAVIGPPPAGPSPYRAEFTQDGAHASILDARAVLCGGHADLDITWSNVTSFTQPVGVFVHGVDAAGQQVVAADRHLIDGYLPLDRAPAGLTLTETRRIDLAPGVSLPARFYIGVYRLSDVNRFRAQRADGSPWEGDQLALPATADAGPCQP